MQDPARVRTVERPRLMADVGRASRLLGWQAQIRFEDGLAELIRPPAAR